MHLDWFAPENILFSSLRLPSEIDAKEYSSLAPLTVQPINIYKI